ncbi:glycosyl hydrolases family 28 domain-containing protein [Sarocladium implicatum]|nr:glycosyl hydrolases family 28 domain-containing protein [Sarocladium implicatum]
MHLSILLSLAAAVAGYVVREGNTCTLYPESLRHNGDEVDDAPSVHEAFEQCGHGGKVIFSDNTFFINSVLNTTNLENCDVSLQGELRWSTDFDYWKENVYSVIFQNQSTCWLFGGTNVTFLGEGGWYNGNGQAWYDQNKNQSNQYGRPISITFYNSTNLWIDGLTIIQPQFWATHVWESKNVSIVNFIANATSNSTSTTVNTDGFDSWNADQILIENATVYTRDDCIAPKGNTTNLHVKNVTCHWSNGMTIGSVGQYPAWPDYVQNVTFEDVKLIGSRGGAYIKTWQGETGDDSDDSGGGRGLVKNITFRNFEMEDVEMPIQITQCIYTQSGGRYCDTSKMAIEDVVWENFSGTSVFNIIASLYCTSINPCPGVKFKNVDIHPRNLTLGLPMWDTDVQEEVYMCANLEDEDESGIPCNKKAPNNFSQHPKENIKSLDD